MKKKYITILIIVVLILFISFLVLNSKDISPIYKIEYFDGFIPGNNYTIYIDKNYNIQVIDQPGCSTQECYDGTYKPKEKKYKVKFSEENQKKLKSFLEKLFENEPSNEISLFSLNDEKLQEKDAYIIKAIIFNNEEIMKEYE